MSLVENLIIVALFVALVVVIYLARKQPFIAKTIEFVKSGFCKCTQKNPSVTGQPAPPSAPAGFSNDMDSVTMEKDPAPGVYGLDTLITGEEVNMAPSGEQSNVFDNPIPTVTTELSELNKHTDFEQFIIDKTEVAQEGFASQHSSGSGPAEYGYVSESTNEDEQMFRIIGSNKSIVNQRTKELRRVQRAALESRNEVDIPFRTVYAGGVSVHKSKPAKTANATQFMVSVNADEETGDVDMSDQGPIVTARPTGTIEI